MSISQSPIFVHGMKDPSAEANMYTISSTSKFSSEITPVIYYPDPKTKKGYYLIGSKPQGFENTAPNQTISMPEEKPVTIQPVKDAAATKPDIRSEKIQQYMEINETLTKAYDVLFNVINNKTIQIQSISNNSTKSGSVSKGTPAAEGGWGDKHRLIGQSPPIIGNQDPIIDYGNGQGYEKIDAEKQKAYIESGLL